MKKLIALSSLFLVATQTVAADNFDTKQIYFGGGLSVNDIDIGDKATGFQVFAGMPLPVKIGKGTLSAEVGYMDSGDFEYNVPFFGTVSESASGLWGTAVATIPLQDKVDLLGRIGYDIGDDDGIMFGFGIGLPVANKMDLRFEYVVRDNIDSIQANLVIRQ